MTTKEKVKEIQDYIQRLNAEILYIRETCPHTDVTIEHIGSTGNFDPSDDGYVKRYECLECGKVWFKDV
jgi:hypothetical protein